MATTPPDRPLALDDMPTQPAAQVVYTGRYAVEKEMRRGGMGRVYRARDLKIARAVAVKVLSVGGDRERFEQEARAAGALNHPNILAVYDVGEHAGEPYIVTELLEGETLREALENGPLAPGEVLELGLQLADGVAAAHRKGIVHRDLKPDNLFITEEGRLKILDFGIARLIDAGQVRTDTGAVIGTPAYMSPEQVRGEKADARSDVFSLGGVLYEMLSGRPPFLRGTSLETAYAIVHDTLAPLPDSPLAKIIARCLEKDPAARYANGAEVFAALRGTPALRGVRLRRRVTLIAAAMLIAWLALIAVVLPKVRRQREAAATAQQVIAVFPFAVRGAAQSAYLGEGMVDLLSTTLASRSLRTVDPHALLARVTREGWTPDPGGGRAMASDFGARRYVLGTIVEAGGRLRIHASVYDAEAGAEPVREVKTEGESSRIFDLVDDLTAQIRADAGPPEAGERFARLAERTTASPEALSAYLDGMRAKHATRFPDAVAAFQRAIAADPSFVLAHYTLAYVAWLQRGREYGLVQAEARRAMELRAKLPEQDQQRIDAFSRYVAGTWSDGAVAIALARQIVGAHPDDVDTWLLLGEMVTHLGHRQGLLPAAAREPLEKALALDPRNFEAGHHLLQIALLEGDTQRLSELVGRVVAPAPSNSVFWQWIHALATHDEKARDALRDRVPLTENPWDLLWATLRVPGASAEVEAFGGIAPGLKGQIAVRAAEAIVTGKLKLARQRFEEMGTEWKKQEVSRAFWWEITKWYALDPGAAAADRLHIGEASIEPPSLRLSLLGSMDALLGDMAGAEKIAAELDATTPVPPGSTVAADSAAWTRALAAWRQGRPAEALAAAERMKGDWPPGTEGWTHYDWTAVEYFEGEMLYALGRYDDAAHRLLLVSDWHLTDWFLAPRMRRLGQIEERRGNREKAIDYYSRFIELWKDCDRELRPMVSEARERLAALR